MAKDINWVKIQWPYNSETPYNSWDCYEALINGNKIILHPGQWPTEGWSYVVKHSHSGFLPGITDLEEAKSEMIKRYFNKY